ncbi:MAG: signal peptidase II [Oscillospiraceae bacterium]|nr:signal peptidase II [Oscillospiraceae bacterium]
MKEKKYAKNNEIKYFIMEIAIVVIVIIVDQIVKLRVESHIPEGQMISFIRGFIDITFVKNTGAAFGMFSNSIIFLLIIRSIMAIAIVVLLIKYQKKLNLLLKISMSFILAGALGNLLDQFFLGYVRDMFSFAFVEFAIFNVADICITLGTISLIIELLLKREKEVTVKSK